MLLNLIAWIFAFNVRYFSASNILRQKARAKQQQQRKLQQQQQQQQEQQEGDDLAAWQRRWAEQMNKSQQQDEQQQQQQEEEEIQLLDRVDMIFCMQGFDTSLIHTFLLETLQTCVREDKLNYRSSSLCVAALRCLRQLLRLMELHVRSSSKEVCAAVQQQLERWIGSGIVSELSYVLRRYKPRSTNPYIFLFAAECTLSLISLLQQLGGCVSASLEGLKIRKSRRPGGAAAAAAFWDDEETLQQQQQQQQQRTRQVTTDDLLSDFFRGDIIRNCMFFVSSKGLGFQGFVVLRV